LAKLLTKIFGGWLQEYYFFNHSGFVWLPASGRKSEVVRRKPFCSCKWFCASFQVFGW